MRRWGIRIGIAVGALNGGLLTGSHWIQKSAYSMEFFWLLIGCSLVGMTLLGRLAGLSTSWNRFASGLFLVSLVYYPFISRNHYFRNLDTLDVIIPAMVTFYDYLTKGTLLLWNPHVGVGVPNLVFAHFPLEVFSPFYLLFGCNDLTFQLVMMACFLGTVGAFYLFLTARGAGKSTALFFSTFYLALPYVGLYMHHIVHKNSMTFLPLVLLIQWYWKNQLTRPKTYLFFLVSALLATLLGTKLDLFPFVLFSFLYTMAFRFFVLQPHLRLPFLRAQLGSLAICLLLLSPFLIQATQYFALSSRSVLPSSWFHLFSLHTHALFFQSFVENPHGFSLVCVVAFFFLLRFFLAPRKVDLLTSLLLVVFLALHPQVSLPFPGWIALGTCLMLGLWWETDSTFPQFSAGEHLVKLVYLFWIPIHFFQTFLPTERIEAVDRLQWGYSHFAFFLLFFPAAVKLKSKPILYGQIGFLLVILCRYHFQAYFVQVIGAVWHPKRDSFVLYFFILTTSALTFRWIFWHLRPYKNWLTLHRLGLIALGIAYPVWFVFYNPRLTQESPHESFVRDQYETLTRFFEERHPQLYRTLAIPAYSTIAHTPWAEWYAHNPNQLQKYGALQVNYYDSLAPKKYSDFINKITHGPTFDPNNFIVNFTFPHSVLRFFNIDPTPEKLAIMQAKYGYMRLTPATLHPKILRILGVRYIITEVPVDTAEYDYLTMTTMEDRKGLRHIGDIRHRGFVKRDSTFHKFYEVKDATPIFEVIPLTQLESVANHQECLDRVLSPSFLANPKTLVQTRLPPIVQIDDSFEKRVLAKELHPHHEIYQVEVNTHAFFLRKVSDLPFWTATVNDKKVSIMTSNCAFQGIFLDPGKHVVEFKL